MIRPRSGTLKLLTTVSSRPESDLISARLREAGIEAVAKGGPLSAEASGLGPHDIYVEDADLGRARDVLQAHEGISEDELVKAEEEDAAARHHPPDQ
jgi:hypothetical protein